MIKVTVAQSTVRKISYTDKRSGKPAAFYVQMGYAHTLDKDGRPPAYPEKVELGLETEPVSGEPIAYKPGDYTLHPSAIYVDRNGRFAIAPRLTPVPAPAPAPAPATR